MCRARNIYFDFADLNSVGSNDRYREDLFKIGQVGGRCKFNAEGFKKLGDHKSPLQSWYSELQTYQEMSENPLHTPKKCDVIINEPTFVIKLDAGINMYHHFCDFVNLYVTQHANNSFFQNVNVLIWDTSSSDYWSYFSDTWKVFSNKKLIYIRSFDKKKVI
jgi:protein O-GlcNAc transferase